jgi:hypothetical protein
MKTLFLSLLLMLAAIPVLAFDGQDIMIDDTLVPGWSPIRDVKVANDGTIFAISHGDTAQTVLNVYRSDNGGSTWKLWDQIASFHTDGRVHDASLAITDGNPGSVLIAWIDQRLNSPGSWVRVSRAPVADEVPAWSSSFVYLIFNLDVHKPRIDTIASGMFQHRVVVAYQSGQDIQYANSGDSGDTWSTPVDIFSETSSHFAHDLDVAADQNGVAHMTWTSFNFPEDTRRIHYRRATLGGEFIGNWDAEEIIYATDSYNHTETTIAADHGTLGQGVIIGVSGSLLQETQAFIFQSDDAGLTWETTGELDWLTSPVVAWGSGGPVIAAAVAGESNWDSGWAILTPDAGGWSQDYLLEVNTGGNVFQFRPAVALDPTRDDAPLLVGLKKKLADESYQLWFNAAWRGDAGFGVPEHQYFSATSFGGEPTMVLVGDVTGDALQEVTIVTDQADGSRTMKCLDPLTGSWVLSNSDMSPVSDVAMVNLDSEPALEVFSVRASDSRLSGRDGDGYPLPGFPMDLGLGDGPYFLSGGPMISEDLDWLVIAEDNILTVLGRDGVQPPGWPWTAPAAGGVINGRVAFGDVDADGFGEMVVPLTERTVILSHDGQVEAVFGAGMAAAGTPSLADFDDDGDLEIVIPRSDGTVHLVHHDGTSAGNSWPYDTGIPGTPSQVALSDIAGDERRDLVFMDAAHGVHAVTPGGTVVMNWDMDVPLGSPVVEPMVAKVGPDERAVIIGGVDGRLRVRTVDGFQEGWPRDMGGGIHAPVAVADVDSDGRIEMVVATTEEAWILDMGTSGPFPWEIWPMSGADPRRRGSVGSGPIAGLATAPLIPGPGMVLHGAAPNPFNPATTISFSLDADVSAASLQVSMWPAAWSRPCTRVPWPPETTGWSGVVRTAPGAPWPRGCISPGWRPQARS